MQSLHPFDCGLPGLMTWNHGYGDVHMCQDNLQAILSENSRSEREVLELEKKCESLSMHIGELETTLKRIPGGLLLHLSGEELRRARKRARSDVRLHTGSILVWINYWQWVRVSKKEAREFIDRMFAERCVVDTEADGDDVLHLHVRGATDR